MNGPLDFCLAVFAANEAQLIGACLRSIDEAVAGRACHVDVMLNGTTDATPDMIRAMPMHHTPISVWHHPVGDKAMAINNYLALTRPDAPVVIMMDAYVRLEPQALVALVAGLGAAPRATIASGVPRNGRSARSFTTQLLAGGGINGNLYAMRQGFVDTMVARGYRLPVGLYRTDPLIGSMAAHDLDPLGTPWTAERLIGVAEAGYAITPLSPLRWSDIRRQFRRELRQARGLIENEAIKSLIYANGYSALPKYADHMIMAWLATHKFTAPNLRKLCFLRLALSELKTSRTSALLSGAPPALMFSLPARGKTD